MIDRVARLAFTGRRSVMVVFTCLCVCFTFTPGPAAARVADPPIGYYRQPALQGETILFVAEGDVWRVGRQGGTATRLTSHPGDETHPTISPDGTHVAFIASYEGPTELYVMPIAGGLPRRLTFDGGAIEAVGWTDDDRVIYSTRSRSTLPNVQLVVVGWGSPDGNAANRDAALPTPEVIPLWQASDGVFLPDGALVFTRQAFQGSHAKRYKGGTAQQLWRFDRGAAEATPLTADFLGTSRQPMFWNGRVVFASDRDGTMNLWSMLPDGTDLRQHTRHQGFDVLGPSMDSRPNGPTRGGGSGRVVYQLGADLRMHDLADGSDRLLEITLLSDLDQTREQWIESPMEYLTTAHPSGDGSRVVMTARGRVFVAPAKQGRLVEVERDSDVRYRDARFLVGKSPKSDDKKPAEDGKKKDESAKSPDPGDTESSEPETPPTDPSTPEKTETPPGEADVTADAASTSDEDAAKKPPAGPEMLLALSDRSGEVEFWLLPADGVPLPPGEPRQLTSDGEVLRWVGVPSPDGTLVAHTDKNLRLWILDVATGTNRLIATSTITEFEQITWSPDGAWFAVVGAAPNSFSQILLCRVADGTLHAATTDRFNSFAPTWSPDGTWLWFISDRHLVTTVSSPWGPYQPEPFMGSRSRLYGVALQPGTRSPFAPLDELHGPDGTPKLEREKPTTKPSDAKDAKAKSEKPDPAPIEIELEGLAARLIELPVPPGTYASLAATDKALFWISGEPIGDKKSLVGMTIDREEQKVVPVMESVESAELCADRSTFLVRRDKSLHLVPAKVAAADAGKTQVPLSGWRLSVVPRVQWRQMFLDAWRLHRDYFYDPGMHGVDWKAMRDKYLPLVDRVTSREELSDLLAQMVGELSALHTSVRSGDRRRGSDSIAIGFLGAELVRDEARGGWRVERVFAHDPDEPSRAAPLNRPGSIVEPGETIVRINGVETLSVEDPSLLLRGTAGRQVLLHVRGKDGAGAKAATDAESDGSGAMTGGLNAAGDDSPTDVAADMQDGLRRVITVPISAGEFASLRYGDWTLTRREMVEERGEGKLGYVHLRAMGSDNWTEWAKGFYPVFIRDGLIIDVRHNRGGNIDSWILNRLIRRAWFGWSHRVGAPPLWNMQFAFRGHVVVLCDEWTASDGEAFAEGAKRLNIGPVVGTRTWGGEIWLSAGNVLVDRGIATAAEFGVYGPEGTWLIEGHGVEPDVVVDNLPHETFNGRDRQLETAIELLRRRIEESPIPPLNRPPFPTK